MNYMDRDTQIAMNVYRVTVQNETIGVEFFRMIQKDGYEKAVDTINRIAKLARCKDFV